MCHALSSVLTTCHALILLDKSYCRLWSCYYCDIATRYLFWMEKGNQWLPQSPCHLPITIIFRTLVRDRCTLVSEKGKNCSWKKVEKWQQCGKMRREEQKGVKDLVKAALWQLQKGYGSQSLNVTEDGESGWGERWRLRSGGCMEESRMRRFQRRVQGSTLDEQSVDFAKWSGGDKRSKTRFTRQTAISYFFFSLLFSIKKQIQLYHHNKNNNHLVNNILFVNFK